MSRRKPTLGAALAFALLLTLAGPAAARDRNRDGIPDRWEKRHQLSLKVDQARRDQDHDGLRNRGEFRARMDPRDADTDNDGVADGREHAGTIVRFDRKTGVLTIDLFAGSSIRGRVNRDTEIECDDEDDEDDHSGHGRSAHHGDEDCGTAALARRRVVEQAELRRRHGRTTFEEVQLR